jgi:hypothetical protein
LGDFFARQIVETGRLPLFCFFVAFILAFVFTRVNVRLIRAEKKWFKNITAGDVHIHHVVFGVILMLLSGIASFAIPDNLHAMYAASAAVFGVGAALVLDEFALILHLRDVYWMEEGRASVDAVFVAIAFTGLLLIGARPLGFGEVVQISGHLAFLLYVLSLVINLSFAVLCLLKGKIWTGLLGLFVPVLLYVGAIRLARPGSPWARWHYEPHSRNMQRALRHERQVRRPLIKAKIWVQEVIAGVHDDRSHWRGHDHHESRKRVSGGPKT